MKGRYSNQQRHIPFVGGAIGLATLGFAFCSTTVSAATTSDQKEQPEFKAIHRVFHQPVDHWNPDGSTVAQQVHILVPSDAPADAPVFFRIGAEDNLSAVSTEYLYHQYGGHTPMIFVEAEHRGFGQSLSEDENQSAPTYVRIDQGLADAHQVVTTLKHEFPGPWMAAGYSHGGGLVIDFAATYPDDVEVILSSSGVLDVPFQYAYYDDHLKRLFGRRAYDRLAKHAHNLKPSQPFDQAWKEREFLGSVIKGVTQFPEYEGYRWVLVCMSYLPTRVMLVVGHWIDDWLADGDARHFAESTCKPTLTRREAATGGYTWRVWRYQQCAEVAMFDGASEADGLLFRTREELCDECRTLFGEAPFCNADPSWSPRDKLELLTVPLVFVSGGRDPWLGAGLEIDQNPTRGRHIHVPDGGHCPDYHDREVAERVITEMLRWTRQTVTQK